MAEVREALDYLDKISPSGWHVEKARAVLIELLARLDGMTILPTAEVERLRDAETISLLVGWTPASNTERGKALHELWSEWSRVYESAGGSLLPEDHPELSDRRIRGLAAQRDAKVARFRAALDAPKDPA
jgi:hypothetical protein